MKHPILAALVALGALQYASSAQAQTIDPIAAAPNGETRADMPAAPGQPIDGSMVHAALDPYGTWQDDATYGTIWIPSPQAVGTPFVPYGTHGHWLQTEAGWYWQSDYPFGWLTFHYGRWAMVNGVWAWVPGSEFAPAWVDWRVNDAYVGWAPEPPDGAVITDVAFMFCSYASFGDDDLWPALMIGDAARSIWYFTRPILPTFGIGGAMYAWGPRIVSTAGYAYAQPVPIATAWRNEMAPRAGAPMGAGRVSVAQPVGSAGIANARAMPTYAAPNAERSIPSIATQPVAGHSPPIAPAPAYVATTGAFGPVRPTIAQPIAPVPVTTNVMPMRTVPVQTQTPVTAYHPAYDPGVAAYHPTYVAPSAAYRAYNPSPSYSAPSYYHPSYGTPAYYHSSYSAPSYHSYSAPSYHPSYSAPSYHSYSAPSYHASYSAPSYHSYSAPSYHASYGGGGHHR